MKSCHDFNSTVSLESLAMVWKRFNIPNEYVLHAPGPGQRPYHPCPEGFSISIDALEAGLRFPLHLVIEECLGWWQISPSQVALNSWCYLITFLGECKGAGIVPTRDLFLSCFRLFRYLIFQLIVGFAEMVSMSLMHDNPKVGGGRLRIVSSFPATAPTPTPRVESRSPSKVQEIPAEEVIRRPSEEEARGAPEVPNKRRAEDMAG
ncbi:hypothetical protein BHM03_00000074 [Ensete ventricosum]|uniref:Transposase (putative) gypsy type domain-containing protein n=1 Tax=Ensete ventricosum TaxID=4639 RepID=A0A445M889_ENSVE|nr:hypothetical protein BHM03_00000074 [Ensete ventricosum]